MKCPKCHRPVDHEAESCYSCGYSAHEAMKRFGANEVRLKRIHDAADCLRVAEMRSITSLFDQLEIRFPQILFGVYLGELHREISLGELGFWMLNQGRIDGAGFSRTNEWAILLTIDVEGKQAGISLGYRCEMVLNDKDCHKALMSARSSLMNNHFGDGVTSIFRHLEKNLERKSRKLKKMSRDQRREILDRTIREENSLTLPAHYQPGKPTSFPQKPKPARTETRAPATVDHD